VYRTVILEILRFHRSRRLGGVPTPKCHGRSTMTNVTYSPKPRRDPLTKKNRSHTFPTTRTSDTPRSSAGSFQVGRTLQAWTTALRIFLTTSPWCSLGIQFSPFSSCSLLSATQGIPLISDRSQDSGEDDRVRKQLRAKLCFVSPRGFSSKSRTASRILCLPKRILSARAHKDYHNMAEEYSRKFLAEYGGDLDTTLAFVSSICSQADIC